MAVHQSPIERVARTALGKRSIDTETLADVLDLQQTGRLDKDDQRITKIIVDAVTDKSLKVTE